MGVRLLPRLLVASVAFLFACGTDDLSTERAGGGTSTGSFGLRCSDSGDCAQGVCTACGICGVDCSGDATCPGGTVCAAMAGCATSVCLNPCDGGACAEPLECTEGLCLEPGPWDHLRPGSVRIDGQILDIITKTPLVGATVCVHGLEEVGCATTDADGFYALSRVPDDERMYLVFTAEGYVTDYWAFDSSYFQLNWVPELTPRAFADLAGPATQFLLDSSHGVITAKAVELVDGEAVALAGVEVRATTPAIGPVYLNANFIPDRTLTTTSEKGTALFEVPASGESVRLTFVPPGDMVCTPRWAWDDGAGVVAEAFPESFTVVEVSCR